MATAGTRGIKCEMETAILLLLQMLSDLFEIFRYFRYCQGVMVTGSVCQIERKYEGLQIIFYAKSCILNANNATHS